jgi:ABC-type Fe3+-hydroxamate transport system substrate-binding protein
MQRIAIPRIVSLVPSATEALCLIGCGGLLVGRSHECDFPQDAVRNVPVLTKAHTTFTTSNHVDYQVQQQYKVSDDNPFSLYSLDQPLLQQLRPTHILTQSLCDVCAVSPTIVHKAILSIDPTPEVIELNPQSLQDVIQDVRHVAQAIGVGNGNTAAAELEARIESVLRSVDSDGRKQTVLFLEWLDPPYVGGHWTPQLIELAGGLHPLNAANSKLENWKSSRAAGKSFAVDPQQCLELDPDVVIIAPCGLDIHMTKAELERMFATSVPWISKLRAFKSGMAFIVDGNQMFNRPGPRLVDALEFLVGLLQGRKNVIPETFPFERTSGELFLTTAEESQPAIEDDAAILVDIENAHQAACDRGESMYKDPKTGLMVLTRNFLSSRGRCCGNYCRHCPYGHVNVPKEKMTT